MRVGFYISLFLLILVLTLNYSFIDNDFWARLIVGKTFFQTGDLLYNDVFSFVETHRWIDHEWGSSVVFYFLQSNFGDAGLFLFNSSMIFAIFAFLVEVIKLRHDASKPLTLNFAFFFFALIVVAAVLFAYVRCQIFTFFFFALWLYILERVRLKNENRLLWILPATMVFWANLHGGCAAGLGLLAIYIVGEKLNKKPVLQYIITFLVSLSVISINPYGSEYYKFLYSALTLKRTMITEWQPLFNSQCPWCFWQFKIYLIVISLLSCVAAIKNKFKITDWTKVLVLVVMFVLSLKSIRFQPFFVFSAVAFLYDDIYNLIPKKLPQKLWQIKELSIFAVILFYLLLTILYGKTVASTPEELYPIEEVEFIRLNNLKGNVFANFHYGSYVAYKLFPNNYIMMDGRYEEVYPEGSLELVRDIHIVGADWDDWDGKFYKNHIDIVIAENKYENLIGVLSKDDNWLSVYKSKKYTLFIRKDLSREYFVAPSKDKKYYNKTKYNTNFEWNTL